MTTWHPSLLTDSGGHIHVGYIGAVAAGSAHPAREDIHLLVPVGAARPGELDLQQFVVLVHDDAIADLRRLVARCIDDDHLRQRLIESIDRMPPPGRKARWAV